MGMNRNGYIYADPHLLHSKRAKWIAATVSLVVIAVLAVIFAPSIGKYGLAREFVDELYTAAPEDVADPAAKVEALRSLATDEVVDHLLDIGGIPAVALHEAGLDAETHFEYSSLTQDQHITDDHWTDAIAGSIHLRNHAANTYLTTWRGALYFRIERLDGNWLITDCTAVNWRGTYDVE